MSEYEKRPLEAAVFLANEEKRFRGGAQMYRDCGLHDAAQGYDQMADDALERRQFINKGMEMNKEISVSGQGATLPPMPGSSAVGSNVPLTHFTADQMRAYGQLCIDSRPRSEDSRAKVLEKVKALAPDVADVLSGREKVMFENGFYKCRGEVLQALASTTPQKADDE